ncbi:helix-turn-helix domain-containing protein [Patescibacteria group bacterium]|nr:helix-turn-helix domain-containing protein [Patescibacteria group bacterium]
MQLGKKIKALRESKGLNQTNLAKKTGLYPSQISSLENEAIAPFQDFNKYKLLAEVLDTDAQKLWRIGQQDRREWKAKEYIERAKILKPDLPVKEFCPIPILNEIPSDIPKFTEYKFPKGTSGEYFEFKVTDPNAFFLRVGGECMFPEIKKEDLLLIYPNEKIENGDIVLIKNNKDQKKVRRITFQPDQVILTADNLTRSVIVWKKKEDMPKMIGKVMKIIRKE